MQEDLPPKEKSLCYPLIYSNVLALSSRKFNMHFNYNEEILNQTKKLLIILDQKKIKKEENNTNELKMYIRKSIVRNLMMRKRYDEIVDKHLVLMKSNLFKKLIAREDSGFFHLINFLFFFFFVFFTIPTNRKFVVCKLFLNLLIPFSI